MISLNGGYAMIKYNSTQEELQIAYRSKKPVLCYDENRRAHWAVIEETATESVDEETQEPITIYEYSYRLIDEASGGGATLEDIVDSQGNNRFINGYGIWAAVPGMQGSYARWILNGYNLMFEALGSFQTNVDPDITIVSFKLPTWILNKISTPIEGVIDMFRFSIAGTTEGINNATLLIAKTTDGKVAFNAPEGITFTEPKIFRIRYNLIIDDL